MTIDPVDAPIPDHAPVTPPPLPEMALATEIHPESPFASPSATRWIELCLLLAVSFGGTLYQTFIALFIGSDPFSRGSYDWQYGLVHECVALGLCAYLLYKQGRSFRAIGLTLAPSDFALGIGLFFLQIFIYWLGASTLSAAGGYSAAYSSESTALFAKMFGVRLAVGMLIFTVVNAFYEELIVRAYLMTDFSFLTGNVPLAIMVSSAFQGFYHLYQGWQAALLATVSFLFFSVVYARSRRITPIIIAHMLWDFWAYLGYYFYYRHAYSH